MPEVIKLIEEQEETELEGVELIASYFEIVQGVFIPDPNIAGRFDEDTLRAVGRSVIDGFQADMDSMDEWISFVEHGREMVKQETHSKDTPWKGAANFKSPLIMQSALKFSDRASSELLRQKELVKVDVIGRDDDGSKRDAADRVAIYSNNQINNDMEEWREEHEAMLYKLPYDGCCFKETFFDARLGRPVSNLIKYPNFAINNDVDSIKRAPRFSKIIELRESEVIERFRQGIWIDTGVNFGDSENDEGVNEQSENDNYTCFVEQRGCYDLDGDGYEEPYTFVVQESTGAVVRIMPRFDPRDVLVKDEQNKRAAKLSDIMGASGLARTDGEREIVRIKPNDIITKYGFVRDPNGGLLDIGYSYMLGSFSAAVNTTTNQLVDAGTLSNRQCGWLSKEFRRRMGDSSFRPGEWKSTNLSAQQLQSGVMPLPVKEPSQTLFALREQIKQEAQELSASADLASAIGANAPAATTLALINEAQQSTGAIIGRIYRGMSQEFRKLYEINAEFTDPVEYQTILDDPAADFESDFNIKSVDILPTANPEVASKIQRIQMAEAELSRVDLVAAIGGNVRPIVENYYRAIGSANIDEIFPELTPDQQLQQLLSENPALQDLITGEQERLDLLAAAQADLLEREQQREDIRLTLESQKVENETRKTQAQVKKDESTTVLNLEKAETEDLNNQVSTHTAAVQLDNQALQNEQLLQQMQTNQQGDVIGPNAQ